MSPIEKTATPRFDSTSKEGGSAAPSKGKMQGWEVQDRRLAPFALSSTDRDITTAFILIIKKEIQNLIEILPKSQSNNSKLLLAEERNISVAGKLLIENTDRKTKSIAQEKIIKIINKTKQIIKSTWNRSGKEKNPDREGIEKAIGDIDDDLGSFDRFIKNPEEFKKTSSFIRSLSKVESSPDYWAQNGPLSIIQLIKILIQEINSIGLSKQTKEGKLSKTHEEELNKFIAEIESLAGVISEEPSIDEIVRLNLKLFTLELKIYHEITPRSKNQEHFAKFRPEILKALNKAPLFGITFNLLLETAQNTNISMKIKKKIATAQNIKNPTTHINLIYSFLADASQSITELIKGYTAESLAKKYDRWFIAWIINSIGGLKSWRSTLEAMDVNDLKLLKEDASVGLWRNIASYSPSKAFSQIHLPPPNLIENSDWSEHQLDSDLVLKISLPVLAFKVAGIAFQYQAKRKLVTLLDPKLTDLNFKPQKKNQRKRGNLKLANSQEKPILTLQDLAKIVAEKSTTKIANQIKTQYVYYFYSQDQRSQFFCDLLGQAMNDLQDPEGVDQHYQQLVDEIWPEAATQFDGVEGITAKLEKLSTEDGNSLDRDSLQASKLKSETDDESIDEGKLPAKERPSELDSEDEGKRELTSEHRNTDSESDDEGAGPSQLPPQRLFKAFPKPKTNSKWGKRKEKEREKSKPQPKPTPAEKQSSEVTTYSRFDVKKYRKPEDFIKMAQEWGFSRLREGGRHTILANEEGSVIPVPRHAGQEIKTGLLFKMAKEIHKK